MASGDTLFSSLGPLDCIPPVTLAAELSQILGTSVPAELIPCVNFDDTTVEYMDMPNLVMPNNYSGLGLTMTIGWAAAAATNKGIWAVALRRWQDDAEDLDTTVHTYDYNDTGDIDPASVVGETAYDNITFTNGADMDSIVAGEMFSLRIRRPAPSGTKITGDTRLLSIHIKET